MILVTHEDNKKYLEWRMNDNSPDLYFCVRNLCLHSLLSIPYEIFNSAIFCIFHCTGASHLNSSLLIINLSMRHKLNSLTKFCCI